MFLSAKIYDVNENDHHPIPANENQIETLCPAELKLHGQRRMVLPPLRKNRRKIGMHTNILTCNEVRTYQVHTCKEHTQKKKRAQGNMPLDKMNLGNDIPIVGCTHV